MRVWIGSLFLASSCGLFDKTGSHSALNEGLTATECDVLPVDAFIQNWQAAAPGDGLALTNPPRSLFLLLDQLDTGVAPSSFASLQELPLVQQRMTITVAAILATGKGLTVNCPEVRRLAFGPPKSILEIGQAVNLAAKSPLASVETANLPFERQFLIWEIARAHDLGEGFNAQAHQTGDGGMKNGGAKGAAPGDDRVLSQPATIVTNPVKQLYAAFVGAAQGRDRFPPVGPNASKRWLAVAQQQAAFNALLFELGDHTAPPAPAVLAAQSPTNQNPVHVAGTTEPRATVTALGGAAPATTLAGAAGDFTFNVVLTPNALNQLQVRVQDEAGNLSAPSGLPIRHDSIAPHVAISSPPSGTSTDAIVLLVIGSAGDDVTLKAVRVNGSPATLLAAGVFSASVILTVGMNVIRAEAEDAAGNLATEEVAVQHQDPAGFGLIGSAGGSINGLGASLTIPPGALSQPTWVWITAPPPDSLPLLGQGIVALGPAVAIEAGTAFSLPVTIAVPMDPTLIAPVRGRPSEVALYTFDAASAAFVVVPGAIQTGNTMAASVPHLSIYQAGVPTAAIVQTLAGNGGTGPTSPTVSATLTSLPNPEWTAVNGNGEMFVSSYDGTNTRVFELKNSELTLLGMLPGRGVGLVVSNSKDAFMALGEKVYKVSSSPSAVVGGGMTSPASTTTRVPSADASLGLVRGLALDPISADLYIIGSQYFVWQPPTPLDPGGVRLLVAAFTRPPPAPPVVAGARCFAPGGGPTLVPARATVTPSSPQTGARLLYVADSVAQTLDVVNLGMLGSPAVTIWPKAAGGTCGVSPVSVTPGLRATVLTPSIPADLAGLAVSAAGDVYFTDRLGQGVLVRSGQTGCQTVLGGATETIVVLDPLSGATVNRAWVPVCGYDGDPRTPLGTSFFMPTGIALTKSGDLLVADAANNRLRYIYDASPAADADSDGLPNAIEALAGSNPLHQDSDGDGLSDGKEAGNGTHPGDADSDNDGVDDGTEHGPGPAPKDTDGDGIPDALEPFDDKTSSANVPDEDTLWLVKVRGTLIHTSTTGLASCAGGPQQTTTDVRLYNISAPRHFIIYRGTAFGFSLDSASTPVSIGPGTFAATSLVCQAGNSTQEFNYVPFQGSTCTIVRSCSPKPPPIDPKLSFSGAGQGAGSYFDGSITPEAPLTKLYVDTGTTTQTIPGQSNQVATPDYAQSAPAYRFRIPMERLRMGRAFEIPLQAFHEALPDGSIDSYFIVEATPARPVIDDILAANYVPDVNQYPTTLKVKIEPQQFDNLDVEAKIKVVLFDTTTYPGCAMNANNGAAPCSTRAGISAMDPDVRFTPTSVVGCNTNTEGLLDCAASSSPYQTEISYRLDVEDFAAYTKLRSEAVSIKVGSQQFDLTLNPTKGRVLGRPDDWFATLPVDRGPDNGQGVPGSVAGNKIADVGWEALVNSGTGATVPVADAFQPGIDLDSIPLGDGRAGDGFVALEEYRGFRVRGLHRRLNPGQKDIFIVNDDALIGGYGIGFARNLPTVAHRILGSEMSSSVVNHLATGISGHVDQYRISITASTTACDNITFMADTGSSLGLGFPPDSELFLGRIRSRTLPTTGLASCGIQDPADGNVIESVMGHELGHAINITGDYNSGAHGPNDSIMQSGGATVLINNVPFSFFEAPPSFFDLIDVSEIRLLP